MALLYEKPFAVPQMLPISLGFVAGFIDACTFLALFQLFVAQVTGSFVMAGAQFAHVNTSMLVPAIAIPVFFLVGMATALLLTLSGQTDWMALTAALAIETALTGAFFAIGTIGEPFERPDAPLAVAAGLLGISAMSVQSTLVRLTMAGAPSTNVMTSNTTQLAIDAADWLIASRRCRETPADLDAQTACAAARRRFTGLFPVMFAFLGGTICGAFGYRWLGLWCVLAAVAILAAIAGYCTWRSRCADAAQ
ncbi:MAG: YoaK family protein [Rhodomicrobium sp.]